MIKNLLTAIMLATSCIVPIAAGITITETYDLIEPDYEIDGICYIHIKQGAQANTLTVTNKNAVIKRYIYTMSAPAPYITLEIKGDRAYEGIVEIPSEVYIPDLDESLPVTYVMDGAFENSSELESVTLPPSVTQVGMYVFDSCDKLKHVDLGNTLYISACLFRYCRSLTSVDIPPCASTIRVAPFYGSGIESITLPSNIDQIEGEAFTGANCLKSVICNALSPSDIEILPVYNSIEPYLDVPEGCVLYVPEESVEAYKAAVLWSNFADIRPIGSAAIKDAEAVADDDDTPAYNLLGQPVANPRQGDFIIRNGKKLIVR